MPYAKQKFVNGKTVLEAKHLEYIEDGIVAAFAEIPKFKHFPISLPAANWTGADGIFSQTVSMSGITALSKVDPLLQPEQLRALYSAEISLVLGSEEGSVTAFAIPAAPSLDLNFNVMVTELEPLAPEEPTEVATE